MADRAEQEQPAGVTLHAAIAHVVVGLLRDNTGRGPTRSPVVVERHRGQGGSRNVVAADSESTMSQGGDASATAPDESTTPSAHDRPALPRLDCIQILEVRAGGGEPEVTITAAIAADAIGALCTALSEQLDRHAQIRSENPEDVLRLREHSALVERFHPLAAAEGLAVVSFSRAELHTCLLELTRYGERLDDEHYQAPDLRARLQIIDPVTPVV